MKLGMVLLESRECSTVEPPASDHPKCQDFVVAYESRTRGGNRSDISTDSKRIDCIHFPTCSSNTRSSRLSLIIIIKGSSQAVGSRMVHREDMEIRPRVKWSLTRG